MGFFRKCLHILRSVLPYDRENAGPYKTNSGTRDDHLMAKTRTISEIAQIWNDSRTTLEAEKAALIQQRDAYKEKHEDAQVKPTDFKGHMKAAFNNLNPFSTHKRKLKEYDDAILQKNATLKRRAGTAYNAVRDTVKLTSNDKDGEARNNAYRALLGKIQGVKSLVRTAKADCQDAQTWEHTDAMNLGNSTLSTSTSFNKTRGAIDKLQKATKALKELKASAGAVSELDSLITDMFVGNSLDFTADVGGYDLASWKNLQTLKDAEKKMKAAEDALSSCETTLSARITNQSNTAMNNRRAVDADLDNLLNSLSPYVEGLSHSGRKPPAPGVR